MTEQELNRLTERIIGCAIEVHRQLGPGLLESVYEAALCVELGMAGINHQRQVSYPVIYKGRQVGEHRLDVLVENEVIVELKSVERWDPVFEAQALSYLRLTRKPLALLINFNTRLLKQGVHRYRL
ncbi:MAG: GxxExxY protein [Anaerolineae bacterium]